MLKTLARGSFERLCVIQRCYLHETSKKLDVKTVKEIQIPVPWGHIAGKWWGDTKVRPLIGVHGWEDNAGTYDSLVPLLEVPSFLAIDLPGHGLSSHHPLGRPYQLLDSVIVLRRLAKHFNWENISLIGHSYGSCTSFAYSTIFPDSVDVFISIDCARTLMAGDAETEVEQLRKIGDTLLSLEQKMQKNEPPSYSYEKIVDLLFSGMLESASKESCKILLKRGMRQSLKPDSFYFSRDPRLRYHAMGRFPFEYLLKIAPRVKCNHLSIRGQQGFIFFGKKEEVYLKTLDLIKKPEIYFEHHDVEGTHHLHLNNPERVAPLVNKFLCKVKWNQELSNIPLV